MTKVFPTPSMFLCIIFKFNYIEMDIELLQGKHKKLYESANYNKLDFCI